MDASEQSHPGALHLSSLLFQHSFVEVEFKPLNQLIVSLHQPPTLLDLRTNDIFLPHFLDCILSFSEHDQV